MKVVDSLSAEGDCVSPEFILKELEKHESFETLELSSRLGVDHQKIVGAIKSLLAQDGVWNLFLLTYIKITAYAVFNCVTNSSYYF